MYILIIKYKIIKNNKKREGLNQILIDEDLKI